MALETRGLATVTTGIFSGFKQAIDTVTLIQSALDSNKTDDYQVVIEYKILMTRLEQWGRFCGVDDQMKSRPSASFLDKPEDIRKLIMDILHQIEKLKETGNAKVEKHGLSLPATTESPQNGSDNNDSGDKFHFREKLSKTATRMNWIKTEKQEFESVILKLDKLITSLENFVPECKVPLDALVASVLAKVSDKTQLHAFSHLNSRSSWALALSARAKAIGQKSEGKASRRTTQQLKFAPKAPDLGILQLPGKVTSVWVEWNVINPGLRSEDYVRQIESLTYLLENVSEPALCLPPCFGTYEDKDYERLNGSRRIGLVFGVPRADPLDNGGKNIREYDGDLISHPPRTLASLIRDKEFPIPALGDRFRLAFVLATTVSYFHAATWLHKGLNSESLLFFNEVQSQKINSTSPFITGFQHSRQQDEISQSHSPLKNEKFIQYHHPDADKGFNKRKDLYSLGVILCEIGQWMLMEDRGKNSRQNAKLVDRTAWRDFIVGGVLEDLAWRMGKEYQSVVKTLLAGNLPEDYGDEYFAQEYLEKVIRPLSKCMA
ncbi:prion-inhibition and propagation domain-containing protein [Trichoderma camerunense]